MSQDSSAFASDDKDVTAFMRGLIRRNPHESEFHQAVYEVASTLMPFLREHPDVAAEIEGQIRAFHQVAGGPASNVMVN
ncbi:MAG: hypothetical protein IH973_05290 [Myxococcales bacterium]|nr:hypothetical protein [Myxococcales bacterium]